MDDRAVNEETARNAAGWTGAGDDERTQTAVRPTDWKRVAFELFQSFNSKWFNPVCEWVVCWCVRVMIEEDWRGLNKEKNIHKQCLYECHRVENKSLWKNSLWWKNQMIRSEKIWGSCRVKINFQKTNKNTFLQDHKTTQCVVHTHTHTRMKWNVLFLERRNTSHKRKNRKKLSMKGNKIMSSERQGRKAKREDIRGKKEKIACQLVWTTFKMT